MKKLVLLAVLMSLIQISSFSQCLPDGITFTTQAQIDSFQSDYPGCVKIMGDVDINGVDIVNLNGLSTLTTIDKSLTIIQNPVLISLTGLDNLLNIGGDLRLFYNFSLTNLTGLENLNSIEGSLRLSYNTSLINISALNNTSIDGNIRINDNELLTSLTGLNHIDTINSDLMIYNNASLVDLSGLNNLTTITGFIMITNNENLKSLQGLNNLSSTSGITIHYNNALTSLHSLYNLSSNGNGGLNVSMNRKLQSLEGLDNINPSTLGGFRISQNPSLTKCEIKSICGYLDIWPNGGSSFSDNAGGCNNSGEVIEACEHLGVNEIDYKSQLAIYPNPFSTSTTFSYTLQQSSSVQISIFNHLGEQVEEIRQQQTSGKQQIIWNAEGLPSGVYFYRMHAGEQFASGKMILVN